MAEGKVGNGRKGGDFQLYALVDLFTTMVFPKL